MEPAHNYINKTTKQRQQIQQTYKHTRMETTHKYIHKTTKHIQQIKHTYIKHSDGTKHALTSARTDE